MRRPLNWVVVCLSLLVLIANLSIGRNGGEAGKAARPALESDEYAEVFSAARPELQFGYVRADGSFLPLAQKPPSPEVADADPALYTSSSPVL